MAINDKSTRVRTEASALHAAMKRDFLVLRDPDKDHNVVKSSYPWA